MVGRDQATSLQGSSVGAPGSSSWILVGSSGVLLAPTIIQALFGILGLIGRPQVKLVGVRPQLLSSWGRPDPNYELVGAHGLF